MCASCEVILKDDNATMLIPRRGKINSFLLDIIYGHIDGFPLCCILRFAIDSARNDGKIIPINKGQAAKRGVIVKDNDVIFVPCNIFHHKTHSWGEEY